MSLFNRKKKDNETIPEDLKPYYAANGGGIRRFIGPILRALVLLVLVGLVVWGGIWSVSKIINRGSKTDTGSTDTAKTQPAPQPSPSPSVATTPPAPKATTPTPAPTATPAPVATPAPAPTAPSATTEQPATSTQSLANTGPGETVALFAVVSLVGGLVYRYRLIRKLQ